MSSQEGKSDKGHKEAGGYAQTEVETGGVWPGARNTWSSWGLERGGSSELQKAGSPARHLEFEFSASRTAGEEVCVKPQQLPQRSSGQEPAHLAQVVSSVFAKRGLFLEVGIRYWPSVLLDVMDQVTVLPWPDSDRAAGQPGLYVIPPRPFPHLAGSVSRVTLIWGRSALQAE
jgi:hypothetical protein